MKKSATHSQSFFGDCGVNMDENLKTLRDSVAALRSGSLETLQKILGETDQWPHIRKEVLNLFGERGIEGLLLRIKRIHAQGNNPCRCRVCTNQVAGKRHGNEA